MLHLTLRAGAAAAAAAGNCLVRLLGRQVAEEACFSALISASSSDEADL